MHEVRLKIRYASLLLFGLFWVFDVVIDTGISWRYREITPSSFCFIQQIFEGERKVLP